MLTPVDAKSLGFVADPSLLWRRPMSHDPRSLALAALGLAAPACFAQPQNDGGTQGDTTEAADSSGGSMPSSGCPAKGGALGSGTDWDGPDPLEDITFTAEGSPHRVYGMTLWDVTLRVEPCAVVLLGSSAWISTAGSGRLEAIGTPDAPIVFDAIDPSLPWRQLTTSGVVGEPPGFIDLAEVTLRHGGDPETAGATLLLAASDIAEDQIETARVRDVAIESSGTYGVRMITGAVFTEDSTGLTVHGSPDRPVVADADLVAWLPPGDYAGNVRDEILLNHGWIATQPDITIRDRGLPYAVGDADGSATPFSLEALVTDDGTPVTLTIEPGVELRFFAEGITIAEGASLVARGTADAPIRFTSGNQSPAAGDWRGILFEGTPGPDTAIDHAEILFAGKDTLVPGWRHCAADDPSDVGEAGAVVIAGPPSSAFVTDTRISQSASAGINRAWQGPDIDFTPTNTFEDIAACAQTMPVPDDGVCPEHASCDG